MAIEKVVSLGLVRDPGYIYYLKGTNIHRRRFMESAEKEELVREAAFEKRDPDWLYYLDAHGDIARSRRNVKARQPRPEVTVARNGKGRFVIGGDDTTMVLTPRLARKLRDLLTQLLDKESK